MIRHSKARNERNKDDRNDKNIKKRKIIEGVKQEEENMERNGDDGIKPKKKDSKRK